MREFNTIPVEYDLRPAYYDKFHCLAADCHLSCCKGWQIAFDKKDYLALKGQTGSQDLNRRMAKALRRRRNNIGTGMGYGEFKMTEDADCPLHCENGLCALQLEKGHEALPYICKIYPRIEGPAPSGYFERALTPSCEAVLALLWDLPDGVDFRSDPLPRGQIKHIPAPRRGSLTAHFQEIRSQCIDFLQNRRFPLPMRILRMGLAMKLLADGEADVDRWNMRAQALNDQAADGGSAMEEPDEKQLSMFLSSNIQLILKYSLENDEFSNVVQDAFGALGIQIETTGEDSKRAVFSPAPYMAARARFQERFGDREYFMENIMVSLFFQLRYPELDSPDTLWRSYVNFCNLYSFYRFMAVMSCREGASGGREELFRLLVHASRLLIHNGAHQSALRDELFENDSATLAHMAILLCG